MTESSTAQAAAPDPFQTVLPALGAKLLACTQGLRARSVSWHDGRGETLWASAPVFGVEHREALRAALEAFTGAARRSRIDWPLPDQSVAVMQSALGADGRLLGFVMLQVDSRMLAAKGLRADLPVPAQRVVEEFGRYIAEGGAEALAAAADRRGSSGSWRRPVAVPDQRPLPSTVPTEAEIEAEYVALREMQLALHVQPLQALRSGMRLRRFEVLLRSGAPQGDPLAAPVGMFDRALHHGLGAVIDRRVVSLLVFWLRDRVSLVEAVPSTFTINLSANAFEDSHFLGFMSALLERAGLPEGILGVEISAALLARRPARAAQVAAALDAMGCGLVIDDHLMNGEQIDLLRLPGLRMVKLHPSLLAPGAAVHAHGLAAGCAQMGRVVGFHTAAKQVEDPAQLELCRVLGLEFAQGYTCGPPMPIDSITAPALVDDGQGPQWGPRESSTSS